MAQAAPPAPPPTAGPFDLGHYDDWLYQPLVTINEQQITIARLILIGIVLALIMVAARLFARSADHVLSRLPSVGRPTRYLLVRICYYGVVVVGITMGLLLVGIDFTKLALIAGALSIGIGFGLQHIVSNFIAGIIMLFDRSIKINDYVELQSGVRGVVAEILMRYTRVTTNSQVDILVPNSEFINGRVVNFTHKENILRMKIPFGVAYGSDKRAVEKAVVEAAKAVPYTLPDSPLRKTSVWITGFGDSSLDFDLVVWVNEEGTRKPERCRGAYLWAIDDALAAAGIEIPFPQRDLHLRSGHVTTQDDRTSLSDEPPKADPES